MWPIAALLLEYLALSLLIDAPDLVARFPDLGGLALGRVGTLLVAACTATLLTGRGALLDVLRGAIGRPTQRPAWLTLHLANAAAFLGLSAWLAQPGAPAPVLWLALWLALVAALPVTVALAATAPSMLAAVARRLAPHAALGLGVGVLAWAAANGAGGLWKALRSGTFHAVAGLLGLAFDDVTQDVARSDLALGEFRVHVAPQCSGVEGLGLAAIFLAAYLWFARRTLRFPQAWALLPVGLALVLASNVVRIAALMVVGVHVSPELAVGGFHSKAGWVLFCAIALGLVAASQRWLSVPEAEGGAPTPAQGASPTAAYLVPLLALIGTHLTVGMLTAQGDVLYALGIFAACATLATYRRSYAEELQAPDAVAAAAGLLCGVAWVAWAVWTRDPAAEPAEPPDLAGATWALWVSFRVAGSTLVVPVVEELAFRGYLLRRVVARDFTQVPYTRRHWPALALSSAVFGALHSQWVAGIGAGLLFGLVVWRRGRLIDGVLAHVVANVVVAAYVLLWDDWALW